MSTEPQAILSDTPNFGPRLYWIAGLVSVIIIIGLWLVSLFTQLDFARDVQTWQEKLNLIAESRTADVNQWVSQNLKELRTMADNPSLQLYLTELQMPPAAAHGNAKASPSEEPSQKVYLRNLLLFTASHSGYTSHSDVKAIPANLQPESKSGLAILSNDNEIIVSTMMTQESRENMLSSAQHLSAGQEGLIDIRKDSEGTPYIGFIAPIYAIQGDHNASSQIGRVIGIKTVDDNLYGLLKHPGTTENTLETILVRVDGEQMEYLSPLQDGTTPLSKKNADNPKKFAEAALIKSTGSFINDMRDYRDKLVLATSRSISNTPWTLIVKIDRTEALAASDQRRASMVIFFFLIIAIIVLIIIAIWWHAHSHRAMLMSRHFRKLASWAMAQEELLRLVSDNQPEPIYIVDTNLIYQFANQKTGEEMQMLPENIVGKTLNDVRGTARAEQVKALCAQVLKRRQISFDVQRVQDNGQEKVIRSAFVPLDHIPVVSLPDHTPGVLVVEQDISEVIHEREQRLTTMNELVGTLVKLVDKRDPFAANHSLLVSEIAGEVATDMELNNVTVDTTRTAGSLMNIGKIVVPTELLTKTKSLTEEEKAAIRDSMNAAADLIREIHFEGPVAETLRQWQEKWDGSGPLGLKGESILVSARIIAVTNAFIGMISPRSWRNAMPIEAANKFLLEQSGTHFDRRVVVALIHHVENHSGKAWLDKILGNKNVA